MAYLNNKKFYEIREAAKNGDVKAKEILQAMLKGQPQEDLNRLIQDYYNIPVEPQANTPLSVPTPNEDLDKDFEGLLDENEIEDRSFSDFLKTKKNNGLRLRKNADYFKMYDPMGREDYLNKKSEDYRNKFSSRMKGIDRDYRDFDKSLSKYSQSVNDMLDDDKELEIAKADEVYNSMTDNDDIMTGLRRGYDEEDFGEVKNKLQELVNEYGKKNVMAALNTLRSDNDNYKNYRNGQINTEIERYQKSLEKLLK